jgi:sRNA-binding protein
MTNKNPGEVAGAGTEKQLVIHFSPVPTSSKPSSTNKSIPAVLELLAETWPDVFPRYEKHRRPLKIGIHLDVLARLDGAITPVELAAALSVYCGNHVYLKNSTKIGAPRIGLDGAAAGIVSADEAEYARARLIDLKGAASSALREVYEHDRKAALTRLGLDEKNAVKLIRMSVKKVTSAVSPRSRRKAIDERVPRASESEKGS